MTPVEELKQHYDDLLQFLVPQPSLAISTRVVLAKALLLAGASELETDVTRAITEYFDEVTSSNRDATQFVVQKALNRQYHAMFNWNGTNANMFFALFGPDFKTFATERVRVDKQLSECIKGFLQLGRERNLLVHGNFAAYSLSLTVEEIINLYNSAAGFRDRLPGLLRRE
jgi:hypothetical protein